MPALTLLDRNGVHGAQRFSVAAREQNIRPIIRCELSMDDGSILLVLVEDRMGYKNLCELLTQADLRSEKGKCAVRWNELPQFAEGLIAFLGRQVVSRVGFDVPRNNLFLKTKFECLHAQRSSRWRGRHRSEPDWHLHARRVRYRNSADRAELLIETFGRQNLFVEIRGHLLAVEERNNRQLVDLARAYRLSILATNGAYAKLTGARFLDVLPVSANTASGCRGNCSPKQRAAFEKRG